MLDRDSPELRDPRTAARTLRGRTPPLCQGTKSDGLRTHARTSYPVSSYLSPNETDFCVVTTNHPARGYRSYPRNGSSNPHADRVSCSESADPQNRCQDSRSPRPAWHTKTYGPGTFQGNRQSSPQGLV